MISIEGFFLGGTAHADDVRAIATSITAAETQGYIMSDFAQNHDLFLNQSKSEIVEFSNCQASCQSQIHLPNANFTTVFTAKCLGYHWSPSVYLSVFKPSY